MLNVCMIAKQMILDLVACIAYNMNCTKFERFHGLALLVSSLESLSVISSHQQNGIFKGTLQVKLMQVQIDECCIQIVSYVSLIHVIYFIILLYNWYFLYLNFYFFFTNSTLLLHILLHVYDKHAPDSCPKVIINLPLYLKTY